MLTDILTQGIWHLPAWGIVVFTLISCHITLVSITLFLHRAMAHRAIDLHPALSYFMRLWLWLTTGMRTDEWVAVHRKHHTFCERTEDPHSPIKEGIWSILFGGALFYRRETANSETLVKYASDMPERLGRAQHLPALLQLRQSSLSPSSTCCCSAIGACWSTPPR